jgi:tRNA modification GTPase
VVLEVEGARIPTWVSVYRSPRSYTREDMAEALLPGSEPLLGIVTRALADSSPRGEVRWAGPGEFTLRAFSSGRIDLSQAEAVAALMASSGEAEARAARRALRGDLSAALSELRREILALLAGIEAGLDFPDEELPEVDEGAIGQAIASLREKTTSLRKSTALRVRGGDCLRVVLVGFPNAGKSSLLNALLGRPAALTSHLAGTTRDPVRGVTQGAGGRIEWVDVAGVRDLADLFGETSRDGSSREECGGSRDESREIVSIVERLTRREIQIADVVAWVADAALPLDEPLAQFRRLQAPAKCIVLTKSDLLPEEDIRRLEALPERPAVVSAKERLGLGELARRVLSEAAGAAVPGSLEPGGPRFLVSARQELHALECERSLGRAQEAAESSVGLEYAAADLRDALRWLEDLTGKEPRESVLDLIFSRFCIGK